jgi:hypothetical protein
MATVTGTQRQLTHTSNTYESNTTIDVAGNITVGGTVDGIDIAARDACLTATINTACAALPKAGGAMTGAITTNSTFDGRNVSVDGAKLDGICSGATANIGTITCVAAGNGLTGGGSSGSATLTVGAGTAITVAAGTVGVTTACNTAWNAKTTCTGTVCTLGNLGVTATAAELNYTTGVTSAIQTQLNAKLPKYSGSVSNVSNSGYTTAFTVVGNSLGSHIRLSVTGTATGIVVSNLIDLVVNHSLDIMVEAFSGIYTRLYIKIISDSNENFAVQFKTNNSNAVTLGLDIVAYSGESVTFTSSHSYTGSTLEVDLEPGKVIKGTGGDDGDFRAYGTVTGVNINATGSYQLNAVDVINAGKCFIGDQVRPTTTIADAYIASASAWNAKTTCTGTITSVVAGAGLTGGATSGIATLCHSDTSSQGSINNSNGTVIQDVTLDTYGHVTLIGSYNLDSRYYTETESDGRYLRNSVVNSLSSVLNICEPSGGNIIYDLADNGVYIPKPSGASYHTLTNVHTGAIAIKLPTATWNNSDMISFHVDIYDYAGGTSGESVTLYIYGFHQGSLTWANVGAVILSTLSDKDYTVRFGHDGTRPIVWIGETTSVWNFPQIIVRDVQAGNTANHGNYYSNWDVVPNVTTFGTVNLTSTGNYPYAKAIIGPIYTVASLPAASPAGQRGFVTDSSGTLANSIGQTLTAGGSNTIPVYSDGSSWKAG